MKSPGEGRITFPLNHPFNRRRRQLQMLRARMANIQKKRAQTYQIQGNPSTSGTQEAGPSSQPELVSARGLESNFAQLGITGETGSVLVGVDGNNQNENINPVSSETAGPSGSQLPSRSIAARLQKEFAQMGVGGETGSILVGAEVHQENEFENDGYESDENDATLRAPISGSEDTLVATGDLASGQVGHHEMSFTEPETREAESGNPGHGVRKF